jgi:hypothetical protein
MKGLSHRRCIGGSSPIISSLGGVRPAGYAEGRNVSIEFRSADGRPERFPELMSELVRLGVDVILHVGPEASLRAAQEATTAVPIARWPSSRSAPRRHLSAQGAGHCGRALVGEGRGLLPSTISITLARRGAAHQEANTLARASEQAGDAERAKVG